MIENKTLEIKQLSIKLEEIDTIKTLLIGQNSQNKEIENEIWNLRRDADEAYVTKKKMIGYLENIESRVPK
jgi:hypothetical protein